jgi:membrane associated rhomboid family serine protease
MFRNKEAVMQTSRRGAQHDNYSEHDEQVANDAAFAQTIAEQSPSDEFLSAYHDTKPESQRRLEEGSGAAAARTTTGGGSGDDSVTYSAQTPYEKYSDDTPSHTLDKKDNDGKKEPFYSDAASTIVDDDEENTVYIVKQRYGYAAISFAIVQTAVLITMVIECGLAPFGLNPMIGPYPDGLSYWGGKNAYLITEEGEWWRLLTPIFLHAGILHLIGNVCVQLDAGAFFEREWGSATWLAIYLISAVGSSLLSCAVMPQFVSVGSSGAVCGLFGGKLAEIFCRACESKKTSQGRVGHEVRNEQLGAVLCSVFVVGLFSFVPFVDWGAHLGGLLGGVCVGMVIFPMRIKSPVYKYFWLLIGIIMSGVYFGMLLKHVYTDLEVADELADVCEYYKQMSEGYECNCQLEDNE